ncbi:Mms1p KNAG_0F03750 [Huiozyma naganishii CBS 8797]|uniref:Uncharacterized protein n=1 Tax=Huiozyma naganishii (strain ATCC MYA-139 / BCRC 22969 / CBS 8797 / KCTC 17520 / NBRC 10181 / NCYC 3082 / Yp74L-3) TaxID=1071383 RepID=J7S0K9_HUIN7|nr:hypothetical protein KNAG_0F03750 [Kazachstania naganishii CBS 8797]CCK71037.1 hypothetical protein KNAG_0F03750 [Kazachstania naganishii CBS 8797]
MNTLEHYESISCLKGDNVLEPGFTEVEDNYHFREEGKSMRIRNIDEVRHDICIPKKRPLLFYYVGMHKGTVGKWCFPFRYNTDALKYDTALGRDIKNDKRVPQDYSMFQCETSAAHVDPEHMNELPSRDPDTLDDSDIEMLAEQEMSRKKKPKMGSILKSDGTQLESTYLIVGEDFFQLSNSHLVTKLKGGIADCQVIRPSHPPSKELSSESCDDILLVMQDDGYLLSISPMKRYGQMKNPSKVLQYWNLGVGKKRKIIKNTFNENEFVVIDFESGVVKFFLFVSYWKIKLVNSLILDNAEIMTAIFCRNLNSVLVLSTIKADRIVYFVIEWNAQKNPRDKFISQVTDLQGIRIDGCIPFGNFQCLTYSEDRIQLLSISNIISGQPNSHIIKVSALRGIRHWFEDVGVIERLKYVHPNKFKDCQYSVLISTSTGTICCAVINQTDEVHFYALTRFKGLRNICVCKEQPNEMNLYNIALSSFNRTVILTINLHELVPLPLNSTSFSYPSPESIHSKRTINAGSNPNGKLVPVPSKNEVWIGSSSSLLQLSPVFEISQRKTKQCAPLIETFQVFTKIEYIPGNALVGKQMVWGTDNFSMTKCFALEKEGEETYLVELFDLLPAYSTATLFIKIYNDFVIQIVSNSVLVKSFEGAGETKVIFQSADGFDGAVFDSDKVILWNIEKKSVFYIDDLRLGDKCEVRRSEYFNPILERNQTKDFEIQINHSFINDSRDCYGDYSQIDETLATKQLYVILKSDEMIYYTQWSDFLGPAPFKNGKSLLNEDRATKLVFCNPYFLCFMGYNPDASINIKVGTLHSKWVRNDIHLPSFNIGENIQMKRMNDHCVLLFTSQRVFLIRNNQSTFQCEEVKLPYQGSNNYISDITFDEKGTNLFILYGDGMQIVHLTYITWNKNDYLLRNTRCINKDFVYLDKLSRMLVLNKDNKDWYCLKLETGKIVPLPTNDLEGDKIQSIVEVPSLEGDSNLIIVFQSMIKYVKLVTKGRKIKVKEVASFKVNSLLKSRICVNPEKGTIVILEVNSQQDIFHQFLVGQDSLIPMHTMSFYGKGEVTDFLVCGNNIIVSVDRSETLWVIKNFNGSEVLTNEKCLDGQLIQLPAPKAHLSKLVQINESTFAANFDEPFSRDDVSKLALYDIRNVRKRTGLTIALSQLSVESSIFENFLDKEISLEFNDGDINGKTLQYETLSPEDPYFCPKSPTNQPDFHIFLGFYLMKGRKPYSPYEPLDRDGNQRLYGNNYFRADTQDQWGTALYYILKFDRRIADMSFDYQNQILSLLTYDQSLIQFGTKLISSGGSNPFLEYCELPETVVKNACYDVAPVDSTTKGTEPSNTVYLPIDSYGRRKLR